ncbi:hypothetical protein BDV12DRAFT_158803 [Aspergillus spectabilis]
MCSMALLVGQTRLGQIAPVTPEEEGLDRKRKKSGGMQMIEIRYQPPIKGPHASTSALSPNQACYLGRRYHPIQKCCS